MKVTIYTDGSSLGNPGPGGYGAVLRFIKADGTLHEREISEGYEYTTNNRMEIMAVIKALEKLTVPCEVDLYTDSKYVCDTFNQHWMDGWLKKNFRDVKNVDLWKRLLEAKKAHKVNFFWVKGHAGNELNERCDMLARTAATSSNLKKDCVD